MTGFFGSIQIFFYQLRRYCAFVWAQFERLLPTHSTTHVPTYLHKFQF